MFVNATRSYSRLHRPRNFWQGFDQDMRQIVCEYAGASPGNQTDAKNAVQDSGPEYA